MTGLRSCLHCRQEFAPSFIRQAHCHPCRTEAKRQNTTRETTGAFPTRSCRECGTVFVPDLDNKGWYCSPCQYRRGVKSCEVCGAAFRTTIKTTRACSRECGSKLPRTEATVSLEATAALAAKMDEDKFEAGVQLTELRRRLTLAEARALAAQRCPACKGKLILEQDVSELETHDLICVACARVYGQVHAGTGRLSRPNVVPKLVGSAPGRRPGPAA